MKTIILFCFILFCSAVSLAQTNSEMLLPEGYSPQSPLQNVSNIGFHNPSFLSRFNGISAGISYQYGSWIGNTSVGVFKEKNILNGIPFSAAFSYQSGDFHVAAAITQNYNLSLETIGGVSGIYINNPDGSKKAVNLTADCDIHNYSIISSYKISSLPDKNSLSFGLKFSLGQFKYNSHWDTELPLPSINTSITATAFALGADYKLDFEKGNLSIGACYENGLNFQKDVTYKEFNHNSVDRVDVSTPDAIKLDFLLDLSNIQITAGLSEIYWHLVRQDYKNNLDFSTGINYKASDWISFSLGAFMTDRKYVNHYSNDVPDYNALFVTLGTDIKYGNYTFGFSVTDSHLTSADSRKQTLGKLTLGFGF